MELFSPESGLIIWMLVVFLSVVIILGKFAWPAITEAIAKRELHIANAIRVADEANEKFERIKEERVAIINEAREEQNRILKEVHTLREKLMEEAKEQAITEANRLIEDARLTIKAEKKQALKEVRNQVALLSVEIAGRVLRKNLESDKSQLDLVNTILDDVKSLKN